MAQRRRLRWALPVAAATALALASCDDGATAPDTIQEAGLADAPAGDGPSPDTVKSEGTAPAPDGSTADASVLDHRVVILHTNDLHDQLMGFEPTTV